MGIAGEVFFLLTHFFLLDHGRRGRTERAKPRSFFEFFFNAQFLRNIALKTWNAKRFGIMILALITWDFCGVFFLNAEDAEELNALSLALFF